MPEPNMPGDTNRLQTVIGKTLLRRIGKDDSALFSIVITSKKADAATRAAVLKRAADLISEVGERTEQLLEAQTDAESSNIHAQLQGKVIRALVERDLASETPLIEAIGLDLYDGKIFNPDHLVRSVIAIPLLRAIETSDDRLHAVVIEVNISYSGGRPNAKKRVVELITDSLNAQSLDGEGVIEWKTATSEQYVYARLAGPTIRKMVAGDMSAPSPNGRAVYRIWPDFRVRAQVWKSVPAIKGDACRRAFASTGEGIVWAVLDSGIDGKHPHFEKHKNLELPAGLKHMDFVGKELHEVPANELTDPYGHGTHVAGIIAGEVDEAAHPKALVRERDAEGVISYKSEPICCGVYGVAPSCKLVSYRVLDETGDGEASTLIAAIQQIQNVNGYGRHILIHGVNMSLGYDFDPEWFACGQSPLCVEVDRLVKSGVAVVIAAGNTGKGFALTINDPGNAELAITVGATHREMPHRYGVSYFSSKGPTGDGRRKPDLLAPGERIISCGAGPDLETYQKKAGVTGNGSAYYLERSGTSMAAPHVSGMLAGILSVRSEFIGLPEELKKACLENATDLHRDPNFQGAGLADMMRTIQAL